MMQEMYPLPKMRMKGYLKPVKSLKTVEGIPSQKFRFLRNNFFQQVAKAFLS
jgi:hypothetical protein